MYLEVKTKHVMFGQGMAEVFRGYGTTSKVRLRYLKHYKQQARYDWCIKRLKQKKISTNDVFRD